MRIECRYFPTREVKDPVRFLLTGDSESLPHLYAIALKTYARDLYIASDSRVDLAYFIFDTHY